MIGCRRSRRRGSHTRSTSIISGTRLERAKVVVVGCGGSRCWSSSSRLERTKVSGKEVCRRRGCRRRSRRIRCSTSRWCRKVQQIRNRRRRWSLRRRSGLSRSLLCCHWSTNTNSGHGRVCLYLCSRSRTVTTTAIAIGLSIISLALIRIHDESLKDSQVGTLLRSPTTTYWWSILKPSLTRNVVSSSF